MRPILVSTCLLGILTRYDGTSKRNERVLNYLRENKFVPIPVCPEQLAGLATPRPKTFFSIGTGAEVLDGSGTVVNEQGETINEIFLRGALETVKIARLAGCQSALLKERSPSCGVLQVYQGRKKVAGQGVTAALLQRNGIDLLSEDAV
jgi:uncharacterized protein YbbK (DUF523 family)